MIGLVVAGCGFHGPGVTGDAAPADVRPMIDGGALAGFCPALPAVAFTVTVADATALRNAVSGAQPGDAIGIADGTYDLRSGPLTVAVAGVTLRSISGDAAAVILEGGASPAVGIAASSVTVASLTIARSTAAGLRVSPAASDATGTTIYDVTFEDNGGPAILLQPTGGDLVAGPFPDTGTIACSRFHATPAGPDHCTGNVLGIEGRGVRGWTVRDNDLRDVVCTTKIARTILFHGGSRDTQILRNQLTNSNMNIMFGIGSPSRVYPDAAPAACGTSPPDHRGGLICDNVIDGVGVPALGGTDVDTGIGLWSACDAWVMHNTIASPAGAETDHDIEYRFASTYAHIVNNLLEAKPAARDGATTDAAYDARNVTYAALADFVNASTGDFHLASTAPEMPGASLAAAMMCTSDASGAPRAVAGPTPGAYER